MLEYEYEIVYKKGTQNNNADAKSRLIPVLPIGQDISSKNKKIKELKFFLSKDHRKLGYTKLSLNPTKEEWLLALEPIKDKNYNWKIVIRATPKFRNMKGYEYLHELINRFNNIDMIEFEEINTGEKDLTNQSKPSIIKEIKLLHEKALRNIKTFQLTDNLITEEESGITYIPPNNTLKEQIEILNVDLRDTIQIIVDKNRDEQIRTLADHLNKDITIYIWEQRPELDKQVILAQAHGSELDGHYGIIKTLQKIRRIADWPNIVKDVTEYVKRCEICQRTKNTSKQTYCDVSY